MRVFTWPLLIVAASCGPSGNVASPRIDHAETAQKAPIVVSVVVDQLGAWVAEERFPLLPKTGGIARLKREGLYVRDTRYLHAITDTAPGHAAIYTGQPPRTSGIFANDTFTDDLPGSHAIIWDPKTRLVGVDGPTDAVGVSLAALQVQTLADMLRSVRPDADIVSISLKDRGAIFGGGRAPSASLWFEPKLDAFVTSTALATELPAWAKEHASHASIEALRAPAWAPLDPAWVSSHALTTDTQPGEADETGFGTVFPHLVSASKRPAVAFRSSPYADEAVLRLALDALAAHDASKPMLLALSFSGNDTVGHLFGPDSWEVWDNLLRLDGTLSTLASALDAKVGPEGWSLVLTADHGSSTLPEAADVARPWCGHGPDAWERPCGPLGRIIPAVLADELEAEVRKSLGKAAPAPRIIRGVADPYVYFTREIRALPQEEQNKVEQAVRAALLTRPAVDRVASYSPAPCAEGESVDALVCRSLTPKDPGLFVALKPGQFFDADYVVGKGSSHGAPYLYNRSVPVLVRAPRKVVAGSVDPLPHRITAVTATLASLLSIRAFPVPQEESLVR